jgi:hypothetical protein
MTNLQRYTPRGVSRRDVDRWLRSVWPRSAPPSRMPGALASLGLLLLGAGVALCLAPMNGTELRSATRKRWNAVRRQASDFAASHDPRAHNGRSKEASTPRREANT